LSPLFYFIQMMSASKNHFPCFRFLDGKKWLYNPVLRKRFANRPEERVRLQFVDYLLSETGFSKNRIGFEAPVTLPQAENTLRADLVLYDRTMNPFVLIECKSEKIRLNQNTGEQIARYNRRLNASFIMITNGVEEIWYDLSGDIPKSTDSPLKPSSNTTELLRSETYWVERGFISPKSNNHIGNLATAALQAFFGDTDSDPIQYLEFPPSISPLSMNHYYRVSTADPDHKVAYTTLDGNRGATMLTAAINRGGKNLGAVWINLDQMVSESAPNARLLTENGPKSVPLPDRFRENLQSCDKLFLNNIGKELLNLF